MQQENGRRVFRAGLSVEDGKIIDLDRAIKSRMVHEEFLSVELTREAFIAAGEMLRPYLENDFQFDRRAKRKACDAIHQAARALVFSENGLQQLRRRVRHLWLFSYISYGGH